MSPVSITASVHYIKEMAEAVRYGKIKINLFQFAHSMGAYILRLQKPCKSKRNGFL
jgi:hypothetical protein